MAKHIQLDIADPCHENWDKMTKAEQGRFCVSCQKQVVDFTAMSDSQIAAFFKKRPAGSICGRFFEDQLERDIEIPRKRIPWVKYFFQFALPAFLISMKATAQGKPGSRSVSNKLATTKCPKVMGAVYFPVKSKTVKGDIDSVIVPGESKPFTLKGRVINEDGNAIPFATVMIKGTKIGVAADSSGVFKMDELPQKKVTVLFVSSVGYEAKEITLPEQAAAPHELLVQLNRVVLSEVVAQAYVSATRTTTTGLTVITKIERKNLPAPIIQSRAEELPMIKVYPNPVLSGTSINIGCQKLVEGYYSVQFLNQSGQMIFTKLVWIDDEAQVVNIDIPNIAAGVYFLRLVNKATNKRLTEKIVVE